MRAIFLKCLPIALHAHFSSNVIDVACGDSHIVALCEGGTVYSWGDGTSGRTGKGDTAFRNRPTEVASQVVS